jgi:asparagine synthetase B (glutamine-hydrolysing)
VTSLTPVELAAGVVFGADHRPAPLAGEGATETVSEAFEAALRPALRRSPCLVSFSGGRDSSAVLALATALARREGLPDPVPATHRIAGAPGADEADWQERVVAHLELADWLRLEWTDELDVLGPIARRTVARHGLLWPFNAHFHQPLLEAAGGGSLLTGVGGDELFGCAFPSRAADVLALRVRPRPRDAVRLAYAAAPRRLRRSVEAHRRPLDLPWLTPTGRRAVVAAAADGRARTPHCVLPRLRWMRTQRYLNAGMDSLALLSRDTGALVAHPLADQRVWAAVAREVGAAGFSDRTAGMRRLFRGLLPDEVLARRGKASFDEVFFSTHARGFAARWDGGGLPSELIDPALLQAHWLAPDPLAQSFLLLQATWLAGEGSARGVEQPFDAGGQRVPARRAA